MTDAEVGLPFCHDSPYLQRALLDQEDYVKILGKYLGDVAKEMRSFNKGLIISINSAVSLAEKMKGAQNIRRVGEDGEGITSSGLVQLEPVLARFSEVLFEIAGAQEILTESLETSFIQPVEKFFKVEVTKVADLRKKLNNATEAHDLALGRFLRPPNSHGHKRDSSPPRRRLLGLLRPGNNSDRDSRASISVGGVGVNGESEHVDKRSTDLATAFREAELCRFNLTFKLNELEARTTFELSECIVTSLYSYRACFHQQLDTVKTLQPFMDDLQTTQKNMRDTYQQAKAPWEVRRQRLNEVFYTMGDSVADSVDASNEVREWLADTKSRVAQLYTSDRTHTFDWSSKSFGMKKQSQQASSPHTDVVEGKQYDRTKLASRKVLKDGYLFLKGTGRLGRAVWHRRWFELDEECLSYVKGPESVDEPPIAVCDLMLATVRDIPAHNMEEAAAFSFEIFSANRHSLLLQASGSEELNAWTSALRNCIEANLCLQQTSPPAPPPRHSPHAPNRNEAAEETSAPQEIQENDGGGIAAELLWEGSGNDVCADCTSKHPEWVSINLGVFLCIECSGIHRSLGTHISKVRSTTLDSLSFETITLLRALGNRKANSVWEHSVQEGWFKPEEKEERATKEQWIRSKYMFRGFAPYDPELSDKDANVLAEKLLHEAAQSGDVVATLSALARGADPNCLATYPLDHETKSVLTNCKASPLHAAAAFGNGEVVELLLQNGANCMSTTMPFIRSTTTSDDIGSTALQIAMASGHSRIANALKSWAK